MSLARRLLIRASRSPWLAEQFRRRAFARRAVRRFMPGEDLGAALGAATTFAAQHIGAVLTELGEQVTSRAEADAVRKHYLHVLAEVEKRRLGSHVSVKLTHLGLDIDAAACRRAVDELADRAKAAGSLLWIDMEESSYVDRTLDIYRAARGSGADVGIAIQAYLKRTPKDLDNLVPVKPWIRLVKGAYNEPTEVAYPKKRDVDQAYFDLAGRLLGEAAHGRATPIFGTHDERLIERIRVRAKELKAAAGSYEVHMLYGIRADLQRRLAGQGERVKVLISYGTAWFAWYMRRLAERPANIWFVVRNLI
jgi:proline dehydrogenase